MDKLRFETREEIERAIQDVRSDATPTNWMLSGYKEGSSNVVVLLGSGEGGVEEMKTYLKDEGVYYGLTRHVDVIDDHTTVKFCFVRWLGEKVKTMHKARVNTHDSQIMEVFNQFHVKLFSTNQSEISEEIIMKLIMNASGSASHVKSSDQSTASVSSPTTVGETRSFGGHSRSGSFVSTNSSPSTSSISTAKRVSSSKNLEFTDFESIKSAINDLRNDSSETDWVLTGFVEGSQNVVGLIGSGSGGVEELKSHLRDNNVYYGMVRRVDYVDEHKTIKFAFIYFLGNSISPMWKGRVSTYKGQMNSVFQPYHVETFVTTIDELTQEQIDLLIGKASFSYSHVKDTKETANMPQFSKSSSTPTPRNSFSSGSSGSNAGTKNSEQVQFADLGEIQDAIKDVRSDTSDTDWMLMNYQQGKNNTIQFLGKGSGGLSEVVSNLTDDSVTYGLLRVVDYVDSHKTIKFVFIHWLGTKINPMMKARVSTHKGTVADVLKPYHVDIFVTSHDELTEDSVMKLVMNASGSANNVRM